MAAPVRWNETWMFSLVVFTLLCIVNVSSLKCWLCRNGASSFDLCDQKKEEQTCGPKLDMCGTFSYVNGSNFRIHGKSCTSTSLCSGNNTFCSGVPSGGKDCRVQCCPTELCNFVVGFASTVAPTTTTPAAPPTTTELLTTTNSPTTRQATSASATQVSTPIKTAPPITTSTGDSNQGGQGGDNDDDDDCDWVDSSSITIQASIIYLSCLALLTVGLY